MARGTWVVAGTHFRVISQRSANERRTTDNTIEWAHFLRENNSYSALIVVVEDDDDVDDNNRNGSGFAFAFHQPLWLREIIIHILSTNCCSHLGRLQIEICFIRITVIYWQLTREPSSIMPYKKVIKYLHASSRISKVTLLDEIFIIFILISTFTFFPPLLGKLSHCVQ